MAGLAQERISVPRLAPNRARMTPAPLSPPAYSLRPVDEMRAEWWLCQVESRGEFSMARELAARGFDYFLPLSSLIVVRLYGTRRDRKLETKPLFPGWIFLNGVDAREAAARHKARLSIIPMNAGYEPKLRKELGALENGMKADASFGLGPVFYAGSMVVVTAGPLMGIQGFVERMNEKTGKLWMNIKILGRAASLEIDMSLLEAI